MAFALPLLLLFILYTLRTMESVMNWDFITWGIYPKETKGIMGILTSPLIHADWEHLFANTFPLLFYYGVCSTFIVIWALVYFFHLDSQWNTYIYNRQAWMAYRCQQYNLFTRLLSVLQRHSPQTRSFSSPVIACHLSIWQPGMEHVPAVRFLHHFLGGTLGGRSGRNSRSYIVQTQRPSTKPELFIDEEEEDNRSYPEDEEVITNPDQEKKE